jgi:hypothetical protein
MAKKRITARTESGEVIESINDISDNQELVEIEDAPGDDPIADVEDLDPTLHAQLTNGTCARCTQPAVWRVERTKESAEDTCRQHAGPAHTYLSLHAL